MNYKNNLTKAALSTAMNYISGDPEKNLPKLLHFIEGIGWDSTQTEIFHEVIENPDNIWHSYLMNLWKDIDNDVLNAIFRNFALNVSLFGGKEQEANKKVQLQYSMGDSDGPYLCVQPALYRLLGGGIR